MSGRHSNAEIVYVISDCRLIDSESYERLYWRRDGRGLARGYYVVRRPAGAGGTRYSEDVEFEGPFARREDAVAALTDEGSGEDTALRGATADRSSASRRPQELR